MDVVPCRWSPSGWKYVKKTPEGNKFFSSPNRYNFHGFMSKTRNAFLNDQ